VQVNTGEVTRPDMLIAAGESPYPGMCERWSRCSVNSCPLDHLRARIRGAVRGDREATCKAPLKDRLAVAELAAREGNKLPWGGMSLEEARSGRPVADLIAEDEAQAEARKAAGERIKALGKSRQDTPGAVAAP